MCELLNRSSKYGSNKIISTCYFVLSESYKNPLKYKKGFEELVRMRDKNYPEFTIRLYVDGSSAPEVYLNKDVDVYKYENAKYRDAKTGGHIELFSTLLRYFPLFGHDVAEDNILIYSDIDTNMLYSVTYGKTIEYLSGASFVSYKNEFNSSCDGEWSRTSDMCIRGGKFLTKSIKLDKNILEKFLDHMMSGKYPSGMFNDKKYKKFPYGVDEYFLNKFVYASLGSSIKVYRFLDYSPNYIISRIYKNKKMSMEKYKYIDKILYGNNDYLSNLSAEGKRIIEELYKNLKKYLALFTESEKEIIKKYKDYYYIEMLISSSSKPHILRSSKL